MKDNFLQRKIDTVNRLTPAHRAGLTRLGLTTLEDLLRYAPVRYMSYGDSVRIDEIETGKEVTLYGTLTKVEVRKAWQSKVNMTEANFSDGDKNIKVIWFSQPYIGKMYPEGTMVELRGKPDSKAGRIYIANPHIQKIDKVPEFKDSLFAKDTTDGKKMGELVPIYKETSGVSSKYIYEVIKKIIVESEFKNIEDPLPPYIRKALSLPSLSDAFLYLHVPHDEKMTMSARKRFLFEEMLYIQMRIASERAKALGSLAYDVPPADIDEFFSLHDFTPTGAQEKALAAIIKDISKKVPMQRLLEGDVGSGKTLVAAAAAYAIILGKRDHKKFGTPLQAAYLAPTEVLAFQQFQSFIKFLAHTGIEIGYLSGKKAMKFPSKSNPDEATKVSRAQLIKWVAEGKISVLIGTHAITKKSVEFKDLALIIIDEQHRFGVSARRELAHKKGDKRSEIPHLLSMTATPIPRTLALAIFGDLDITIIDELPLGRKKIKTELVVDKKRDEVYEKIREELSSGRQAYVICTRIESDEDDPESTQQDRRNVDSETEKLKKIFKEFSVEAMHSKLLPAKKDEVMQDFADNKINILVSTSVVEVGVNVPNATIMIIEDADRFGLSQLHQLRGRIGRSVYDSVCYLFSKTQNDTSVARLKNFTETSSGFELAEIDLRERGAGSLISKKQSGLSDIAMEALKNLKLVETAKEYAKEIIENDKNLENFPELAEKLEKYSELHLE